jgi:F420-non-reducing hydrogenase iron-sulfur subunit
MSYPPNFRAIRVMCSGRVDPQFVLKAFREGADGVLILGCHPGDCHYKEGNCKALRRYHFLKKMLSQLGIEDERLELDWVGASEAEKFARVVTQMVERIQALRPLHPERAREKREGSEFEAISDTISEGEELEHSVAAACGRSD